MEPTPISTESLKKQIDDQSIYIQDIYTKVDQLYKHMRWQRIISWIYVIIIVGPIVASLFFLPTLLNGISGIVDPTGSLQLDQIVPQASSTSGNNSGGILQQYQQLLKQAQN